MRGSRSERMATKSFLSSGCRCSPAPGDTMSSPLLPLDTALLPPPLPPLSLEPRPLDAACPAENARISRAVSPGAYCPTAHPLASDSLTNKGAYMPLQMQTAPTVTLSALRLDVSIEV